MNIVEKNTRVPASVAGGGTTRGVGGGGLTVAARTCICGHLTGRSTVQARSSHGPPHYEIISRHMRTNFKQRARSWIKRRLPLGAAKHPLYHSTMVHNFSSVPDSLFPAALRRTHNPRRRTDEVHHTVPVHRHILLRDHLDRLLREHPAEERRRVRQVCARRARAAAPTTHRVSTHTFFGEGGGTHSSPTTLASSSSGRTVSAPAAPAISAVSAAGVTSVRCQCVAGGEGRRGRTGAALEQRGERGEPEVRDGLLRGNL